MTPGPGPDAAAGTLFVVATPIGNLGDITYRAVEVLREADLILAEDTRASRVLLEHYGITTRPVAAHEHNEASVVPRVLERLAAGDRVALITDSGTPLISDPGARIVQAATEAGHHVSPIPGPSAVTAALAAAGVDTARFSFFGFLPRSGKDRRAGLAEIVSLRHTAVVYESPARLAATLEELATSGAGDRRCVVAREITKKFEEFRGGTVGELAAYYAGSPPKGEIVVVIAGGTAEPVSEQALARRAQALRESGLSARDVVATLVAETGMPRNTVYRIALKS